MLNDTIVAIATGTITNNAISIVRMSGSDALPILRKIFKCKEDNFEGYHIYYGFIVDPDNGENVDEVLVNIFIGPHSYNGEDMVEINCHGGLYVTRKIYSLCLQAGARAANNGEFTERAFLNGKLDLTQAEAVNDLINSTNKDDSRLAMNSLEGSIKKLLDPLMEDVVQIIANIEVNIDYPEYDDVGIITTNEIKPLVKDWISRADDILSVAENSLVIKEGVKTVIVGKPNVGKSSLLNALLAQDKAIVTEVAGTTRDLVEGDVHLNNVTLHLIDTAGIHDTDNLIEQIGIEKSKQALSEAQLVIVVLDGSQALDTEDEEILEATKEMNRIIVYNKQDLVSEEMPLGISAASGDIDKLLEEINAMFEDSKIALKQPALTNERQIALMRQAKGSMEIVDKSLDDGIPLDLVNEDLQNAYRCLKEILGQYHREDLLDEIFSRFCVGK